MVHLARLAAGFMDDVGLAAANVAHVDESALGITALVAHGRLGGHLVHGRLRSRPAFSLAGGIQFGRFCFTNHEAAGCLPH